MKKDEMTIERAIELLEILHLGRSVSGRRACEMAIEALQAQKRLSDNNHVIVEKAEWDKAKHALEVWDTFFKEYESFTDKVVENSNPTEGSKLIDEWCVKQLNGIISNYYKDMIISKHDYHSDNKKAVKTTQSEDYKRGYNAGYKKARREKHEKTLNEFLPPNTVVLTWIPISLRPLNKEEKEYYAERELESEFIYNCELPDDGEEVLITTMYGDVTETTFYNDDVYGAYFENYEDWEDVKAWMKKPASYGKKDE